MTDGWVLVPRGFVEFLLGETAFDGLWFGDAPRYVKGDARYGQFWWRHDLRAMLAAAPPVDGWQPIETAPRDGTSILAICASAYSPVAGVTWWNEAWTHYSRPAEKWHGGVVKWFPTHWMPLPQPPNNERTG
jgi:hypothetical protein